MNDTRKLLYGLLDKLPDNLKDKGTIIRLDLNNDTPKDNLTIVVITRGRYYQFFIEESDFNDLDKLNGLILNHIMNDPNNRADIPKA